ncbi:hypothetical protein [Flavobacterium hibernum]|uniref:Uncharacterized protein n=1 Tax=Flavobacterium hibernum TaxID=37752 RepID=A0A0D0ET24_9FLAO|nr:hypothetical protein [Flavobacterium hibernum]KIO51618.1 hypothetical protein IW18_16895 [Flavobacterium hibernum]OXA85271.1 hypothetical protein B0A73_18185 [Flavobacterium hibernum]STO11267.1 Uncharacterised protein [Flavobacterium hibernum]
MKSGKLIKYLNVILKFDERLRLVEQLISVSDQENKMQSISSNEKCKSCYNKIDFAQLFYVLMDEGLLFFDTADQKSNRSKFQFFLENNFTYAGDEGGQSKIKSISRQFSECKGYTYKVKQIKFLDEFIAVMQGRKRRLESW